MTVRVFQNYYPAIAEEAYVDPQAVVIGRVRIGSQSSVWPASVIRADVNFITIAKRTSVQDGAILHVTHASEFNPDGYPLIIGSDVTIGHQAVLHGCTVGDRCLIGIGAKVLDGAVIEDEVLLGAGSLVPPGKKLASGYLWLGTPVQKVRPLTLKERDFFLYSAAHYVKLQQQYRLENS